VPSSANFANCATDVTIFSAFTALSTLGSIIQQLHYAIAWVIIKEAQFDQAVQSLTHKGLALGGAAQPTDKVLFYIRKHIEESSVTPKLSMASQSSTATMSCLSIFCSGKADEPSRSE
jgi:hypothetical protein